MSTKKGRMRIQTVIQFCGRYLVFSQKILRSPYSFGTRNMNRLAWGLCRNEEDQLRFFAFRYHDTVSGGQRDRADVVVCKDFMRLY